MSKRNRFFYWSNGSPAVLLVALAFLFIAAPTGAQSARPSDALKQINKIAEALERDQAEGRLRDQEEENSRVDGLVRTALQSATQFSIADWKGDELYALAALYQRAEKFELAAQAWQAYLKAPGRTEKLLNAQTSLVRSLIEIEKFAEATQALETLERGAPLYQRGYTSLTVARIALHKNLAEAYRDRGQYEQAAQEARAGYSLMSRLGPRDLMDPLNRDARDYDQAALASIAIISLLRLGRNNEAAAFKRQVEKFDFAGQMRLLAIFQSEMTAADLINNGSPGIKFIEWTGGTPYKQADLKGKVLLLHFLAMWSAPSAEAFPHLRGLQSKYGNQGLQVIGITRFYGRSDKADDLKPDQELKSLEEYKKRFSVNYPVVVAKEDELTNDERFSVYSLPTLVLIDRQGNVRSIRRGTGNWRALEKQVTRLLEEKP